MHEDLMKVRIETDRLLLIPISMNYSQDIFKEFTPEIVKYMTPESPEHIDETKEFITDSIEDMKQKVHLQLVIIDKKTHEFIGCCGLHHVDTRAPELGIWIKKSAHGKKVGREAIIALKNWADKHIEYDHLLYPVDKANIASRKIPESLGGQIHHETQEKSHSGKRTLHMVEYRILRR